MNTTQVTDEETSLQLELLANRVVRVVMGDLLNGVDSHITYEAYTCWLDYKKQSMQESIKAVVLKEQETRALCFLDAAMTQSMADAAGNALRGYQV